MKMFRVLLLVAVSGLLTPSALNAIVQEQSDWPMFRGKAGQGVADGFELATHWNADESSGELKGVLWQTEVPGLGHSSPVVVGDQIFLATAIAAAGESQLKIESGGRPVAADDNGQQSWVVLCYDKKSGEELWRRTAKEGLPRSTRHAKATHANTSVTVDGDNVVAFFGSEGLYCYDLDGKLKWSQDLGVVNISKYGIGWGYIPARLRSPTTESFLSAMTRKIHTLLR